MEEKKKTGLIITIVTIMVLIVGVLGATYAYFQASIGANAVTNVTVKANTVDAVTISPATCSINLQATQANFGSGSGNRTGTCSHTITLTTGNAGAANYTYTMPIAFGANDFVHTSGTTKELAMTITKQVSGNCLNSSGSAITAGTYTLLDAADVTLTKNLTYYVPDLTTTSTVISSFPGDAQNITLRAAAGKTCTHTYTVTVDFVNLNSNQNTNAGKSFAATVTINKPTAA